MAANPYVTVRPHPLEDPSNAGPNDAVTATSVGPPPSYTPPSGKQASPLAGAPSASADTPPGAQPGYAGPQTASGAPAPAPSWNPGSSLDRIARGEEMFRQHAPEIFGQVHTAIEGIRTAVKADVASGNYAHIGEDIRSGVAGLHEQMAGAFPFGGGWKAGSGAHPPGFLGPPVPKPGPRKNRKPVEPRT